MVKNKNIKLLDCTLRDGGYVNNFCFGEANIKKIIKGLSNSGIDLIEIGFLKNGNHQVDQTLYNYVEEACRFVEQDTEANFCLMIRPDWYDITKLTSANGNINTLRFAFHYKDLELTLQQASKARDLGYTVMLNPVNILSYSEQELEHLLPILNNFNPSCVSIVDTFGSILPSNLTEIYSLFTKNLNTNISLGLHLHENLSISLALAIMFIDMLEDSRQGYIDSSVLGIGRIPGNLCTELIANYMNNNSNKKIKLNEIYNLIDDPIKSFKSVNFWGYMPAYAITAFNKIHRSYAEFLMKKPNITLNQIVSILDDIVDIKDKEEFNEELVKLLYTKHINQ